VPGFICISCFFLTVLKVAGQAKSLNYSQYIRNTMFYYAFFLHILSFFDVNWIFLYFTNTKVFHTHLLHYFSWVFRTIPGGRVNIKEKLFIRCIWTDHNNIIAKVRDFISNQKICIKIVHYNWIHVFTMILI